MTKLTLSLDETIIVKAKKIARKNGTSVSKMASDYFEAISSNETERLNNTPVLNEMSGVLKKSRGVKNVKKEYRKYLEDKYR